MSENTGVIVICRSCNKELTATSKFCDGCGTPVGLTSPSRKEAISFQAASDKITEKLGIERIEKFSLQEFFSQVFKKHDSDEIEELFSAGTKKTTPVLNESMGVLPSPWVFFRVLAGALFTYALFYYGWQNFNNMNLVPGLIIVGSFAVPASVLILFYELNTPRNVSITRTIQMVMAGGGISIIFSLLLSEMTPLLGRLFGASSAGIVEEFGKLLAVVSVLRLVPIERYPFKLNGLLFGAAVGSGFAAFESAGYALRVGLLSNSEAMLSNITIRGAMSPFAHIAWTAIAASAYLSMRPNHPDFWSTIRDKSFVTLFGVSVALHFVWNLPFEGPFMVKYWVLGFIAWVVIISQVQSGLREIREECGSQAKKLMPEDMVRT